MEEAFFLVSGGRVGGVLKSSPIVDWWALRFLISEASLCYQLQVSQTITVLLIK